jgi:2-oxoglutarate ferredoxin oxidoreductase subunit alpha
MPTKLEQSDLFHALYGGHGDFPRIVLAPASVQNCFRVTVLAFGLAERYQMPVVILSDQSLSHRTETIEKVDASGFPVMERMRPNGVAPKTTCASASRRMASPDGHPRRRPSALRRARTGAR